MKYFKPELLARCRSLDDDIAEAAAKEWDQTRIDYRLRYKAIRDRLPVGARRLCSRVSLHDAKVLGVSFGERKPAFSLFVLLEGTTNRPGERLELNYHAVSGPNGGVAFRRHSPAGNGTPEPLWLLYDEFDVDEERAFFTHSILMTGGELEVRFHSLHFRSVGDVVSPLQWTEAERTWPLVEA